MPPSPQFSSFFLGSRAAVANITSVSLLESRAVPNPRRQSSKSYSSGDLSRNVKDQTGRVMGRGRAQEA